MAATTTSLYTFLHCDVEPEGHRILLAFLTTKDRLRLSECSQGLIKYRYHLSRVKIVPHPSPTPSMKRALVRLLSDQEGGGLECLRLRDRSVFHVLDLASWGCFERLKILDLSHAELEDEDASYVEKALVKGGLRRLEELNLGHHDFSDECSRRILAALRGGACPRLRLLDLSVEIELDHSESEGIGQAMAEALQSGHCRNLRKLDLSNNTLGPEGATAMIRALQEGSCPHLTKLYLCYCDLRPEDCQALGRALRSKACPALEELSPFCTIPDIEDDGMVAILEAIEAGGCPNMKRLDLSDISVGPMAATALAHALSLGKLRRLEYLYLPRLDEDPASSLRLLEAMKQASFPGLRSLDLSKMAMDADHGRVLGGAIGGGSLPNLEELDVSLNPALGDEGVVHMIAGLEAGGCPNLKKLRMHGVSMGPDGGQALARALSSGNLSNLQRFSIDEMAGKQSMIGDHVMAEIIKGLLYCSRLTSFHLNHMGMGHEAGQALLQILRGGSWTQLHHIGISDNPDLGDGIVGVGLAKLLEESSFPRLEKINVRHTGLSMEGVERLFSVIGKASACPKLHNVVVDES